ncbi:polymorphic toxin type 28 domain-containing protein [Streptomyces sp. Qhu_M48]
MEGEGALPDGTTERGLAVLLRKRHETVYRLDRVTGFLHQFKQQP